MVSVDRVQRSIIPCKARPEYTQKRPLALKTFHVSSTSTRSLIPIPSGGFAGL